MRSAGNFHPEWGYLAPAPSFIRTARMVLVSLALGAAAGACVVLSLVDRPTDVDQMSVAARTLARPVDAASSTLNAPQAAPANLQVGVENQSPAASPTMRATDPATSGSHTRSTVQGPQSVAALAEAPAAAAVDAAPLQKKATKKHHVSSRYASRNSTAPGDYSMNGAFNRFFMNAAAGGSYSEDRWGGSYPHRDAAYNDR